MACAKEDDLMGHMKAKHTLMFEACTNILSSEPEQSLKTTQHVKGSSRFLGWIPHCFKQTHWMVPFIDWSRSILETHFVFLSMNKLNQTGQNSGAYFAVQQNITLPGVSLPKKTTIFCQVLHEAEHNVS